MTVTIAEIRKANFIEFKNTSSMCSIDYLYKVSTDDGKSKVFSDKDSAEAYIDFLQQRKKDYEKVIKEIEI